MRPEPSPGPRPPPTTAERLLKRRAVEAKAEAERILEEARSEAAAVVEDARREADAVRRKAYCDGRERALVEYSELTQQARLRLAEVTSELESDLAELVADCARDVLRSELLLRPDIILTTVRNALTKLVQGQRAVLHVHPRDAERLEREPRAWTEHLDEAVELVRDDSVEPGGCLVRTELGRIDARLDVQLQVLRRCLRGESG